MTLQNHTALGQFKGYIWWISDWRCLFFLFLEEQKELNLKAGRIKALTLSSNAVYAKPKPQTSINVNKHKTTNTTKMAVFQNIPLVTGKAVRSLKAGSFEELLTKRILCILKD